MKTIYFIRALACKGLIMLVNIAYAQTAFVHYANSSNIQNNWTYIEHPLLNGNPNSLIQVTPQYAAEKNSVGVWYDNAQQKWAIYNQNQLPMKASTGFHIVLDGGFLHRSTSKNTTGNYTVIDHPSCNGNPSALLLVTANYNPGGQGDGIYNNHALGVFYTATGQWAIFNQDRTAMPLGAAFNVKVVTRDDPKARLFTMGIDGFTGSIPRSLASLQHILLVTPNWNAGGTKGVYSNGVIQVGYEPDLSMWQISVGEGNPSPGAAFNVLAYSPSNAPDLCASNPNWGFENQLQCWTAEGKAFSNQPVHGNTVMSERVHTQMALSNGGIGGDYWKGMPFPIGIVGSGWIGTYEKGNGDNPQGTLTSRPFISNKRYLHFLLGGGKDINRIYVELQVKKSDYEAAWGTGRRGFFGDADEEYTRVMRITPLLNSEELFRYWFDIGELLNHRYQGKTCRIVIVDNSSGSWGHINVDDIQLSNQVNEFIPVSKGGFGVHMDKNRPLWGFADTHAHPTHQLGFGGQTIGGDTDGNIATALSSDKCSSIHGGCSVNDAVCLAVQKPFVLLSNGHATDGWPNFLGWPRFTTMYHQQQHVDWIKRAYEGGLRLMCALGVTNMYWATRALGAGIAPGAAIDDETVSLQQINLMKDIARRNATWMEIAYTPTDARRIIAQNKLAVVLGVEMDNFGNFKDNSYTWIDGGSYSIPPSARLETLPADNAVAQQRIGQKLDHYYTLGIRQVTPLHYITGVFGGTSIFQYRTGLVNHAFTARSALKGGQHKGVFFHLADDFDPLTTILGNLGEILRSGSQVTCDGCQVSTINSIGLTDKGQLLATQLMRKGFLIDLEHMSYESIDGLFSIANRFNYPILSSHTDPAALSFKPVMTQRFTGSDENKWRTFGTTNIRNLPHEGQLLDENYLRISNSGGTVGVIALPYRKKTYVGWRGSVANDCDGSSKTWAQMYLHSLDKMGGKGVALSTDRGFVHFIGPRFGTNAAYTLSEEKIDPLKKNLRTLQRYAQTNGVRYDRPIQTWHPARFDQDVKDVDTWEIDIWKALAAWTCRVTLAQVPNSSEPLHWGRIRSFVKGLYATNELQLTTPLPIGTGDGPWEESAMYCLKNNILPDAMLRWNRNDIHNNVWRIYRQVKPVWDLWQRMSGNNEPLRRGITGTRDWDINLDGIAHYGMLPDFLQDLKNIGLSTLQLQPLFNSAEDYIQMWEKAERAKVSVISGRLATIEAYAKSEEPVEVSNAVQVYPNPTLGLVTVKVNWPVETLSDVKLYNTLGGILYSGTLKNSLEVNLTGLRGGLYYLVVENQQAGLKRSVKVFKR